MISTNRNDTGMGDGALVKNHDFGRSSSDVNQANSQFALIGIECGIGTSQRLKDDVVHVNTRFVGCGNEVLRSSSSAGYDMSVHLEPHSNHADGILNAALLIDDELLRQQVNRL